MVAILLVEHEERTVERVRDVLAGEGWQVRVVRQWEDAVRQTATEIPDLLLVNPDIPGVEPLLASLSRRSGGPGTVVMVPERPGAPVVASAYGADDALLKPFSDTELRQVVRRSLASRREPAAAAPSAAAKGLTSSDIFGDMLAELDVPAAEPAAAPVASAAPPAAPPSTPRPATPNESVEKRLEQTLSGLMGTSKPAPPKPAPKPVSRSTDVDELLSQTLTDFNLKPSKTSPGVRAPAAAPAPPPAASAPPSPAAPRPSTSSSSFEMLSAAASAPPPAPRATPTPLPDFLNPPARPAPAPAPSPAAPPASVAPVAPSAPVAPPAAAPAAPAVDLATRRIPVVPRVPADNKSFGEYTLVERVAVGGMAELWKATRTGIEGFQKTVAIKRILPHLNDSADFVTMLIDEAKLAALLNHPNITQIFDLGKIGEDHFIAMEFVEGRDLRSILNQVKAKSEQLPLPLALLVAARVAGALDYAHRLRDGQGRDLRMVHRDVSPQNLLISSDGQIKLCDFGIVKAVSKANQTQMGALKGKLQYMSPEQAWGRGVDARSDIFSLGAVLFEMISGRRLFEGSSEVTILDAVREGRSRRLSEVMHDAPHEVEELVAKAVANDPAARFQTAEEMQRRLEQVASELRLMASEVDLRNWVARLFEAAPTGEATARASAASVASFASPAKSGPVSVPAPAERPAHAGAHTVGGGTGVTGVTAATAAGTHAGARGTSSGVTGTRAGASAGIPMWAYAALAVVVVGGGLAYFLTRPKTAPADAVPEASIPADASTTAPAAPTAPNGADTTAAVAVPATDTPPVANADPAAAAANPTQDLARLVDQQIAERERVLRQQYEEERRRLEQQIAAQARNTPPAAAATAPAAAPAAAPATSAPPPAPEPAAPEPIAAAPPPVAVVEEPAPAPVEPVPAPADASAAEAPVVRGSLVGPGPGVIAPVLVSRLEPRYPPLARTRRLQAEVTVEVLVDENGGIERVRLARGDTQNVGFNEAALDAVRAARFRPGTKNGVPVKMWKRFTFPFRP
jgi:TonB family protein